MCVYGMVKYEYLKRIMVAVLKKNEYHAYGNHTESSVSRIDRC